MQCRECGTNWAIEDMIPECLISMYRCDIIYWCRACKDAYWREWNGELIRVFMREHSYKPKEMWND